MGVKHAKGKYVCFIDSDDWIRRLYVEKLHKEIVQNDAEIAVCKMIHVHSLDESNSEPKNVSAGDCQRHMFTQETALRSLVCGGAENCFYHHKHHIPHNSVHFL